MADFEDRLELLRRGLVCEFMGKRWRLLAGEELIDQLREAVRDRLTEFPKSAVADDFLRWLTEDDRLADYLLPKLNLDSESNDWWANVQDAANELADEYRAAHQTAPAPTPDP